ncbi:hypothetical protein [Porphyromonas phage phage005b_ATCC49417]|uniref:Uncharacterized protein n=1 Tax=Porphyromonas phage phage005a_ATCC49417 TaxID=3154097 RepID=A0AAT9J7Z4_9VIRU
MVSIPLCVSCNGAQNFSRRVSTAGKVGTSYFL